MLELKWNVGKAATCTVDNRECQSKSLNHSEEGRDDRSYYFCVLLLFRRRGPKVHEPLQSNWYIYTDSIFFCLFV